MQALRERSMERFLEAAEGVGGIDTRDLGSGDLLRIRTRNSSYVLEIGDPDGGKGVLVSDNDSLSGPADCRIVGATLSGRGTMVKLGWVLFGYSAVMMVDGREVVTSAVQALELNGASLLPASTIQ